MTIIFSDTHLTPDFNPKLFKALKMIIEKADQVIINGDFWDGYLTTFDQFVNSAWRELFPLLKQKQAVYLFGNHDPKTLADNRVNLFSSQQLDFFRFAQGQQKYHIEHGDAFTFNLTSKLKFPIGLMRMGYRLIEHHRRKHTWLGHLFEWVATNLDQKGDVTILKYMQQRSRPHQHFYIVGHTHIPRHSQELSYANPGRCSESEFGFIEITQDGCALKKQTPVSQ